MSGGGASALAHIGVLKALEEYEIPIDYITGTSAGAFVGSLYASGYSPEEIEALIKSDEFLIMTTGKNNADQHFLLREQPVNASLVNFSFSKDSIWQKSLPTNFVSASYIDFELMKTLNTVSASYNNDFDSLFIPYRCVASDISKKQTVVFSKGDLNAAVRASMTYPFYFKPTKIDGVLLFDGGLYNNFPADIMYTDFSPDYIIGSNVSYNASPPGEDDLIGQLTNMLVRYTDFGLPCEQGFIIEPSTNISTFSFDKVEEAITEGYIATVASIDSIRLHVDRHVTKAELTRKRLKFKKKIQPLIITSVTNVSDDKKLDFAYKSLIKKRKVEQLDVKEIEKRYYRLYASPQIDFITPTLSLNGDSTFNLNVNTSKSKEFIVEVGGHLSSRPVNTGYFGLTYQTIGKVATRSHLESYFGKFYGSSKADFTIDFPSTYPVSINSYFTFNRWDYFRSFATFFEEVKPSFLVQNEIYTGVAFSMPLGNTIKSTFDARIFRLSDSYYQTESFSLTDTTDVTILNGASGSWSVVKNSLNRKQFASSGHYFRFKARYVYAEEQSISGTTSPMPYYIKNFHSWINLSIDYQSFLIDSPNFHFGLHGQLVFNSQQQLANYTASILTMTEFSLVPDAKTYFLPEYRSPQFIGLGTNIIFTIKKKIDIRFDGYYYQPFIKLIQNDDGTLSLSKPFKGETFMASSSAIYHSFFGPVRLTVNYFPKQANPVAIQFSIGYVLFNERATR